MDQAHWWKLDRWRPDFDKLAFPHMDTWASWCRACHYLKLFLQAPDYLINSTADCAL
jgi:hypothetical protein